MKTADLIARIRLDVNDIDADRWQDVHLIDIINEAFCEIYNVRPDLFQEIVVAKLEEGEWQKPCCCSTIAKVDGISDANGIKIADIREVDQSASVAFNKRRKCITNKYPAEYGLDGNSGNKFWVNPPVSTNEPVFVRLLCSIKPDRLPYDMNAELNKIGCEYYGALIDYVLYRLYATETESMSSSQKSSQHQQWFYNKIGLHEAKRKQYQNGDSGKR